MPKRIAPLTDTKVRTTKPTEKPQKLFDGGGLFLLVTPTGGRLWRFKYRFGGSEKSLSIGTYPETSLAEARQRRDQASALLANGIDPSETKKAQKAVGNQETETFEIIAREWYAKFSLSWATSHAKTTIRRLELFIFPWLGARPIKTITAPELLAALRRIEAKGALETAHRVKQVCGQVFRYAIATGRAERDPSGDLRGAIPPASGKHMATITDPKEIAGLLRSIDGVGLHAPVLLILDKAAQILPGDGFQGGPTPLFQVRQKKLQRRKVAADSVGSTIAPLLVVQIVLDVRLPQQVVFGQLR